MGPLETLREATAFRTVAALHAYPEALAEVEALVEAALAVDNHGRGSWYLGTRLQALRDALAPFSGQPERQETA